MHTEQDVPYGSMSRAQLLLAAAPYVIAIALLIALASASVDTLSAVRAYVGGESLWSKAQKEAVQALERYALSGAESDYDVYRREIRIPLGDQRARQEMDKETPNYDVAREGFLAGRNHPDDIDNLIKLYRRFRHVSFMQQAIDIWAAGDAEIAQIAIAAAELHRLRDRVAAGGTRSEPPADEMAAALQRLHLSNERVTPLEERFSATLGDAARQAGRLLRYGTLVLAIALMLIAARFSNTLLRRNLAYARALRTSEDRFDLAMRGSSDGIWYWSQGDSEIYRSPRFDELLGGPENAAPREPYAMLALVDPEQRNALLDAVRAMLFARAPLDIEFRFRDPTGNLRWVHVRGRAFRDPHGTALRAAGSIADISERKLVEEQRRQHAAEAQRRAELAQVALLEQVQGRMGRELHDDLGQQLTGIAFLAKALEQRLGHESPTERDQTSWIVKLINEVIDRVRFMSRQLNPMAIDGLTLGTALERLIADVHGIFGTRITLQTSAHGLSMPANHASQFFRIAQESITNALRHGQATRIVVRLDPRGNGTRLAVIDNGVGFAVRKVDPNTSLGLRSMAIRAESIAGCLRVRSSRSGTTLIVRAADTVEATARPMERRA